MFDLVINCGFVCVSLLSVCELVIVCLYEFVYVCVSVCVCLSVRVFEWFCVPLDIRAGISIFVDVYLHSCAKFVLSEFLRIPFPFMSRFTTSLPTKVRLDLLDVLRVRKTRFDVSSFSAKRQNRLALANACFVLLGPNLPRNDTIFYFPITRFGHGPKP